MVTTVRLSFCFLQDTFSEMDKSETYTVEQGIDYIGMGKFQWRLLIILGFCLMADSVETMFLTVLGPALKCDWLDVTDFQIASLTTVK